MGSRSPPRLSRLNWAGRAADSDFPYPPGISRPRWYLHCPTFLHIRVRCVAKTAGLRYRGGKLAYELFPPVVTNQGEGIRRLVDRHGLRAVISFIDDISKEMCLMFSRIVDGRPWCS
jgi:hypothetical protein